MIRHLFISLLQNLLTKACEVPEGIETSAYKCRIYCFEVTLEYHMPIDIGKISLMSPTDINVPITGSLALNQKVSFFQCLAYLNNKKFVCKQIPSLFYS